MKARYGFVVLVVCLVLALGSCGKSEEEKAPATPAAKGPAAQPIDPATAATLSGVVKVEGTVARGNPLNMAAEPACNKEHGNKPVENEDAVVGDGGTLGNVLVYVKEGLGNRTFDAPKEAATIDQKGCIYHPRVIVLQTGQTLQVVNSDQATHNIHPNPSINRSWNKSQPAGTPPINETFAREEIVIPVKCDIHPWMRSYIAVFKHPYHSVTAKDGKFELKNLPPGDYTIVAWHEKLGTSEQKVTLGAKESKAITFTFKAS